jgi:tRNA-dihydrouridine synthase A
MIGREAYHNPYVMAGWDARFYGDTTTPPKTREQVLEAMIPYIRAELERYGPLGLRLNSITRHMLGLMAGLPGARGYRQLLSDSRRLAAGNPELLLEAAGKLRLAA